MKAGRVVGQECSVRNTITITTITTIIIITITIITTIIRVIKRSQTDTPTRAATPMAALVVTFTSGPCGPAGNEHLGFEFYRGVWKAKRT
jgi:hypothetical protein